MSGSKKTFMITRFDPDRDEAPRQQSYEIEVDPRWKVLDALNHIKDEVDPSLSHRWSCRMAVCGSCGMMVDGKPSLTCKDSLADHGDTVEVAPLANFPVIRDLVVELEGFLDKLKQVKPWIIRAKERAVEEGTHRQSPAEHQEFKQFSMCINCMLCYSACPVVGHHPEFVGPAALALAQRYNLDSRDGASAEREEVMFSHEGIWECTAVGDCSRVCPKSVDPAGAIQQAKIAHTTDFFTSFLMPGSGK